MNREKIINFLSLYGMTPVSADDLLSTIEEGTCPYFTINHGKGELNSQSKYTEEQIRHACQLLQERPHLSCAAIARLAKVTPTTVERLFQGRHWRHITAGFDFSKKRELVNLRKTRKNKSQEEK